MLFPYERASLDLAVSQAGEYCLKVNLMLEGGRLFVARMQFATGFVAPTDKFRFELNPATGARFQVLEPVELTTFNSNATAPPAWAAGS